MTDQTTTLLQKAYQQREPLRAYTNAIRLVNGYGDDLDGLVLEQHASHFVAQIFEPRWLEEKTVLIDFVRSLGGVYFVVKDRTQSATPRPEGIGFDVWIDGVSSTVVEEHGVKFQVELNDTLNTGLFLDMRANRHKVAGMAQGRKVLNLFSYTCAFGVHCRKQGASALVNVDVSRKVLDRGRVNYELNGLVPEKNEFIRADAVEYLERAIKKENFFDMIILDPPSFARYDGRIFSVKNDLPRVIEMAVKVLEPKGVLFAATNHSEMLYSNLQNMVKGASRGRQIKKMQPLGQDVDFPGTGFMAESCLTAVLVEF
ncbi:MAG: class I SAM-dependent rRNA methyltransferase [Candidatus Omnitrophica bacterium]|nr:class I SAM-dependent rRNA methyltransferase [Candidatus Omnitrophota bacterium]